MYMYIDAGDKVTIETGFPCILTINFKKVRGREGGAYSIGGGGICYFGQVDEL